MEAFGFALSSICSALIGFLQLAMFLRAIFSWFPFDDNKIEAFLIGITEPIIYPVRVIFDKFDSLRNFPLDIPFFVTFIILSIVSSFI